MTRHAGFAARIEGTCARCHRPIRIRDRIVRRGHDYIHVECSSGWRE
jgi:hypothetical protein